MSEKSKPHLTPANLVGERFKRNTFSDIKIALIGYCPPPVQLKKYSPIASDEQFFIHVTPDSVKQCSYKNFNFLSLYHVYGGPVSASTIEELAYFGIEYILAYGLAGGLGTKELKMGDFYLVENAYAADGTTKSYTSEKIIESDFGLKEAILKLSKNTNLEKIKSVRAITGDAIYQEDNIFLDFSRKNKCDIINLDSSHLYAVSKNNNENKVLRTIECGVISDVINLGGEEWDSTLSVMLSGKKTDRLNPLEITGQIVEFYVEKLIPQLLQK